MFSDISSVTLSLVALLMCLSTVFLTVVMYMVYRQGKLTAKMISRLEQIAQHLRDLNLYDIYTTKDDDDSGVRTKSKPKTSDLETNIDSRDSELDTVYDLKVDNTIFDPSTKDKPK